jgi:hypothetical protein
MQQFRAVHYELNGVLTARQFYVLHFLLWRFAYDLGLGIVLSKQSKDQWFTKQVERILDKAHGCPICRTSLVIYSTIIIIIIIILVAQYR